MTTVEENLRLMKTLDDSWNTQDWDTFNKRHTDSVAVYWPGQPDPTRGRHDHKAEAVQFFKTFPDNHIENDPYSSLWAGRLDLFDRKIYRNDEGADERF